MIRTTGAEWKAFMADNVFWGDYCVEEELVMVNGVQVDVNEWDVKDADDNATIIVEDGYVYDQNDPDKSSELAAWFRKWKRQQSCEVIAIEVPKDKKAAVLAAVKAAGARVFKE